jgi:lipopolysaccharide heptosyltransferase II
LTDIRKILVVRLSSIGDIILTTPLLRSLKNKFPQAYITYLIKKQFAELLADSPYIDDLITFDKRDGFGGLKRIKSYLATQRFDIYIDIHKNWRSRYLGFGMHAKKNRTYSKYIFKRTLLICFKINLYKRIIPVYERYFEAVSDFGIQYDGLGTQISVPDNKSEKVKEILTATGYSFNDPLVIICPSATYTNKRWKKDGFIETAQYLIQHQSAYIVILGGREDMYICSQIASAIGKRAVSMAGMLSLSESAALLKFGFLIIANDSGLLHLAQSQKRPVIGIYGPTTRELGYYPIEGNSTVIEAKVGCRPCTHNGLNRCPRKHFRCMNDITSERVIQAALQYFK